MEMVIWSAAHDPDTSAARELVERIRADRASFIAGMRERLERAHLEA
jgi:hypothetical protein